MSNRLNVKATPAQIEEDRKLQEEEAKAQGAKIVSDKTTGEKFAVTEGIGGIVVKRRLA